MEYKELEMLWNQYDEKLNNLEKINRKLLKETLLQKPQRKLNRLKFSSTYGLIALPIILAVALHPNFKAENIGWQLILGCALTLAVVVYICVGNLQTYLITKKMDLSSDTVAQSLAKITKLKRVANSFRKSVFIHYPVMGLGVIFIGWNSFVFNPKTIAFLSIIFVVTYYANVWKLEKNKENMGTLEKDIMELEEYTEK